MSENIKFREYVTSGAFKLSLSRQQISALSVVAVDGDAYMHGATYSALTDKGLVDTIRSSEGLLEYRLTEAGVIALRLARMAGLVNGTKDAEAEEMRALREQLSEARELLYQVNQDAWNMNARVQKADQAVREARAWALGGPPPKKPLVTLKNKDPDRTQAQIVATLQVAENFLQASPPPQAEGEA